MKSVSDILFESMISEPTMKELVDTLRTKVFRNPLMITNAYFRVIGMSDDRFDDEVWKYAAEYHCCSRTSIEVFRQDDASRQLFEQGTPFVYDTNLAHVIPRILGKIRSRERTLGYLVIFAVDHAFSNTDLDDARIACRCLSVLLRSDPEQADMNESFLSALLKDRPEERYRLESEISQFRQGFKDRFRVLNAPLPADEKLREYAPYIVSEISAIHSDVRCLLSGQCIVVLCNYDEENACASLIAQIKGILGRYGLRYGKSRSFGALIHMLAYNRQAMMAREIGMLLGHEQMEYAFADYLYHYLLLGHDRLELNSLLCKEYRQLCAHDRRHGSEYADTLITYFLNGFNITETAASLHIHRNSLRHRLERIEEIMGSRCDDVKLADAIYHSQMIDEWLRMNNDLE